MGGIDDDIIGQRHDLVAQRMEKGGRKLLLRHVGRLLRKVGAAHIANEKRVATEDGVVLPV
ncbi:MAG: hypothetical protein Q8M07_17940, partial [Prosthecobacter sp.]|nr:hypothetical protein [Prosthecobacter sp.]